MWMRSSYVQRTYTISDKGISHKKHIHRGYDTNWNLLYILFSVSLLDYGAVSTLLMFASCETRQCTNIIIINDVFKEDTESFSVSLMRTSELDPRITLDPTVGEIEITDSDGLLYIQNYAIHYVIRFLLAIGCYSHPGCMGSIVTAPGPTARDCCAGTDDGQSYTDDFVNCTVLQCIGKYMSETQ